MMNSMKEECKTIQQWDHINIYLIDLMDLFLSLDSDPWIIKMHT